MYSYNKYNELGDLFADAIKWYAEEAYGEEVDFAFLNASAMDNGIEKGDITPADI